MTRAVVAAVVAIVVALTALASISEPEAARAAALAGVCLVLWLSEAVPPFAPTLLLLAGAPLLLGSFGADHRLPAVLAWVADPVLALFFGGFTIAAAVTREGLDQRVAATALRWSQGSATRLLLLVMLATAGLSLWMSNIAAMALMLAALRPVLAAAAPPLQRSLLLGLAMAANAGGMGTPLGSGPNAVAMGMGGPQVTFLRWMMVGIPAVLATLLLAWLAIRLLLLRTDLALPAIAPQPSPPVTRRGWLVLALLALAMLAWLSEPWHGVPAAAVALALAASLFISGLLTSGDFAGLDWSTIALIGGGIALGRLLEHTGLIAGLAHGLAAAQLPATLTVLLLALAAAALSALMSNTATATLLMPLALALDPTPTLTMVVALACSFGMPLVISTPANAMAAGAGARPADLLRIGLPLMVLGCVALVLCQPLIARLFS